jgi:hypothetical protein
MFGTIGHARPKPGMEAKFAALMAEWKQTVRPQIPGRFLELTGTSVTRSGEAVFLALAQDEATYRALAEDPTQHAFFERLSALFEGEITWEDVEMEIAIND